MKLSILFLLLLLAGCGVQRAVIVCSEAGKLQTCAEEILKKKIRIIDINSPERGVYEIQYKEEK